MYIESFSSFLIQHRTCALFYPDNNFENIQGDKVSINEPLHLLTMYILRKTHLTVRFKSHDSGVKIIR